MVPATMAVLSTDKLLITDLDVKVGGKTDKNIENEDEGYTIDKEAIPGDVVSFKIEVENNFTGLEDLEIEDIEVEVVIESIDDEGDDDLDDESKEFDLKDGRNKDITLDFKIPLKVDEDTYTVVITITGRDENGTRHITTKTLELEVEKENHDVRFTRNSLVPSEVKCGRNSELAVVVLNVGSSDEDDVTLEITNADLGVNFREEFELSDDPFDDDGEFKKIFPINVGNDVQPGVYTLNSKVTFDEGDETVTENVELRVGTCDLVKEVVEEEEEVVEEEVVVVVVQPSVTQPVLATGQVVTAPTLTATEKKSVFANSGFLGALIIGEVLLVLIAILLVVAVMKKRS